MKLFVLLAMITVLPIFGTICLFFPKNIQEWAIRSSERGLAPKWTILSNFFRSKAYLLNVRFVGALAFIMFILIVWGLLKTGEQIENG